MNIVRTKEIQKEIREEADWSVAVVARRCVVGFSPTASTALSL